MIEFKPNTRYKILTPEGYKSFSGIRKTTKSEVVNFSLSNGKKIQASVDHRFVVKGNEVFAKDCKKGDRLTQDLFIVDLSIERGNYILYDPTDVGTSHLFIADDIVSHNCDFMSSGDTVIEVETLSFYEETYVKEPSEKRGVDNNLWIWEHPDYSKSYMVVADVARGDSTDYSTFHVFDVESVTQVAEYKGRLSPKEFGNVLVGIASEYNDALLVIENANIGWSTIEQVLEREYKNLYYSSKSDNETVESYMAKFERDKLVAGFTMSLRTRPLVIAKMTEYMREKSVILQSKRLLEELRVFIWKNSKAQAQSGYNDDLVMAFATALYVRDTAIRMRQQGMDLTRATMDSFVNLNQRSTSTGVYNVGSFQNNPYLMKTPNGQEDLTWLLG